jgi:hypothetical protein
MAGGGFELTAEDLELVTAAQGFNPAGAWSFNNVEPQGFPPPPPRQTHAHAQVPVRPPAGHLAVPAQQPPAFVALASSLDMDDMDTWTDTFAFEREGGRRERWRGEGG